MKKGIFWYVPSPRGSSRLITVATNCSADGETDPFSSFSSKSGDNFNHKIEWEKLGKRVTGGMPYNYYPRGRVEIRRGKATVYLNPDLYDRTVLRKIMAAFELDRNELKAVTVKSDGSEHYRYLYRDPNGSAKTAE